MEDEELNKEIRSLQLQAIALLALIFAFLIFLYIVTEQIKMKKCGIVDQEKANKLKQLSILAATIILLVTAYFVYRAYVEYMEDSTEANKYFLIASTLVSIGALIRLIVLKQTSDTTNTQAQDF